MNVRNLAVIFCIFLIFATRAAVASIGQKTPKNLKLTPYISASIGDAKFKCCHQNTLLLTPMNAKAYTLEGGFRIAQEAVYHIGLGVRIVNFKNSSYSFPGLALLPNPRTSKLQILSLLPNLTFEHNLHKVFKPFVSLGLGVVHLKSTYQTEKKSTNNLGHQFMYGIRAHITEKLALTIESKYLITRLDLEKLSHKSSNLGIIFYL